MNQAHSIMIVAGDPSGDIHAAPIVKKLRKEFNGVKIWGIGGPSMQLEGFSAIMPFEPFNKMGITEVIKSLPFFLYAKAKCIRMLKKKHPDLLICVDYSGFNMPLMKAAHKSGIKVLWYIAPMVWAWKANRAKTLGNNASHIAVILPFEVDYFTPYSKSVSYVGNPVIEELLNSGALDKIIPKKIFSPDHPKHLALIPGSRKQEVGTMLQLMVDAYLHLKGKIAGLKCTVSVCPWLPESLYKKIIADTDIKMHTGPIRELLATADAAFVTSGTATLETALAGIPSIIVYKTSTLTYSFFKHFLKVPFIGLPNIIAGSLIVPECIQNDVTPLALAEKIYPLLEDPSHHERAVKRLYSLRDKLGTQKPSIELFSIIKKLLHRSK